MSNAGISLIDLLPMDHRPAWAPTSTTCENWVAAGKPCLRQNCGHRHGNHIPSEDMECNECDCLDLSASVILTIRGPHLPSEARDTRNGAVANVLMRNKDFRAQPIPIRPAHL